MNSTVIGRYELDSSIGFFPTLYRCISLLFFYQFRNLPSVKHMPVICRGAIVSGDFSIAWWLIALTTTWSFFFFVSLRVVQFSCASLLFCFCSHVVWFPSRLLLPTTLPYRCLEVFNFHPTIPLWKNINSKRFPSTLFKHFWSTLFFGYFHH